jgi:hypothetical protein
LPSFHSVYFPSGLTWEAFIVLFIYVFIKFVLNLF